MKITLKDLLDKSLNLLSQNNEKVPRISRYGIINAWISAICTASTYLETTKKSVVGKTYVRNGLVGSSNARSTMDRIDFYFSSNV